MPQHAADSTSYRVLADPHFFRLLTPWMAGWPGLVLQRWKTFLTTRHYREPADDLAFTKYLVEHDDRRTLSLVISAVWQDSLGHLRRFRFSLHDAITTADAGLVRHTLESNEWIRCNISVWTWFTAVAYFRGDAAILDLLHTYAVPKWTETRIRGQLFRKDLRVRASQLFQTVDVACVQWFVDTFGAASLPSHVLVRLDDRIARFLTRVAARHKNEMSSPHHQLLSSAAIERRRRVAVATSQYM